MSYFSDGVIYIIVPTLSATTQMWNELKRHFNANSSTVRRSTGTPEKILFKVKDPVSSVFDGYYWYNHDEIIAILDDPEGEWV